jgi:hypothetical protein
MATRPARVPKEQRHAARSEVDKHGQAEEAGGCQAGDGEQQAEQLRRAQEGHRYRGVAEERQGGRYRNGPRRFIPAGKALVDAVGKDRGLDTGSKTAFFRLDRKSRYDPGGKHTQGRCYRPDGCQAQGQHEQIRKIRRGAEDRGHRSTEESLKNSRTSTTGRNNAVIGAL